MNPELVTTFAALAGGAGLVFALYLRLTKVRYTMLGRLWPNIVAIAPGDCRDDDQDDLAA